MLKMQFIGTLGKDAEVKDFGDRKAIKLSVAVNKDYKNAAGEKIERTDWINCTFWKGREQSIKVAEYLKKGKKVYVHGEPGVDAYVSKEGKPKGNLTLSIKDIEILN